jgi:GDP-L-fucose synthase
MSGNVVMVTGGSGLVGKAIEAVVNTNPIDGEKWIYLSSKDGDLVTKTIYACIC